MVELDDNKVWIDGCFDFTHHGHAGAILQARQTIDLSKSIGELFCGIHSDEDIAFNKNAMPVMNEQERYAHTRSNRWCDVVVENAPYITEADWLDRYGCKYVIHGDDITLAANGEDCYSKMQHLGRFKVVKRTPSVSTTDIIHRMLVSYNDEFSFQELPTVKEFKMYSLGYDGKTPYCYIFHKTFEEVIVEGGYDIREHKMVLCSGDFDLFHIGHIEQLATIQRMHAQDNIKLIVNVKLSTEGNIMSLKERMLSLLSCKHVDGILIDGDAEKLPFCHEKYELNDSVLVDDASNIFQYLTKKIIIDRILAKKQEYMDRNVKKGMVY